MASDTITPRTQTIADHTENPDGGWVGWQALFFTLTAQPFFPGLLESISMILVSEILDKTFFIAAILSLKYHRCLVYCAALFALAVMTVLSAILGLALPSVVPRKYTNLFAMVLFFVFGLRQLRDAYYFVPERAGTEMEEVKSELDKKDADDADNMIELGGGGPTQVVVPGGRLGLFARPIDHFSKLYARLLGPVFTQTFTLTFLAEWGDRSQIATITLAATRNPFAVALGGFIGHAFCTGVAVLGGALLSSRISERSVNIVGGITFLLFGCHSVYESVWLEPLLGAS